MLLTIAHTWDGAPVRPHATVRLSDAGGAVRVEVEATYCGDPAPFAPPGPTDRLWEHEVVELFVVGPGEAYTEIELGPHGHHLVLRLDGVRRPVETLLPLDYHAEIEGARWFGAALVPRACLPPGPHRLNAFALHGARRYLAAHPVPGPQPDFHRIHLFPSAELP